MESIGQGEKVVPLDDVVGSDEKISLDSNFADGRPLTELVDKLLLAEADPLKDEFLILKCIVLQGKLQTGDNRRLACLREWARRINRLVDIRVDVTATYDEKHLVSNFLQHYTTNTGALPRVRSGRSPRPDFSDEERDRPLERRPRYPEKGKGKGKSKGYGKKGKRDRAGEGPYGKSRKGKGKGRSKGAARYNGREEDGSYADDKDSRADLHDEYRGDFDEEAFPVQRGLSDDQGDGG